VPIRARPYDDEDDDDEEADADADAADAVYRKTILARHFFFPLSLLPTWKVTTASIHMPYSPLSGSCSGRAVRVRVTSNRLETKMVCEERRLPPLCAPLNCR